jgi:hypothetical protein
MNARHPSRTACNQTLRNLVAMLCVLLIIFVGATQGLHTHPGDDPANPGCSLCAVAHISALPTPVLTSPVVAQTILPVAETHAVSAPPRFFSFALYVRPPPALTAHA